MKTVKRERYSNDFKDRALAMVGLGRPVAEVVQELGIAELRRLRKENQNGAGMLSLRWRRAAAARERLTGERRRIFAPLRFGERGDWEDVERAAEE
jgi:transposase-like protein